MISINLHSSSFWFKLEFFSKFNFILGNSGSRKTHFVSLCAKMRSGRKSVNGTLKIGNRTLRRNEYYVFSGNSFELDYDYGNLLRTNHNCLFIIDEFCDIFQRRDLPSWLLSSDNYFIFITRKVYGFLPVHMQAVYRFEEDRKCIINRPCYPDYRSQTYEDVQYVLTEDSKSGRLFFKQNFKELEVCTSAGVIDGKTLSRDNSQLHNFLREELKSRDHILVVYDAAAYAPFYPMLQRVLEDAARMKKRLKILDWDSFEWYLLSLPMFGELYSIRDSTCQFNSLEQMCTNRLGELINYGKGTLPLCFNRYSKCSACKHYSTCDFVSKRSSDEIVVGRLKTLDHCKSDNASVTRMHAF